MEACSPSFLLIGLHCGVARMALGAWSLALRVLVCSQLVPVLTLGISMWVVAHTVVVSMCCFSLCVANSFTALQVFTVRRLLHYVLNLLFTLSLLFNKRTVVCTLYACWLYPFLWCLHRCILQNTHSEKQYMATTTVFATTHMVIHPPRGKNRNELGTH